MSVRPEGTRPDERRRITRPHLYDVSAGSVTVMSAPIDADLFSFAVEHTTATHGLIRLAGEIDMLTAPDFRGCIVDQLAARPQQLILDFSALTFFGCSGLAVLMEVKRRAEDQGTSLHLAGAGEAVARLLYVTRLAAFFGDAPLPPDRPAV